MTEIVQSFEAHQNQDKDFTANLDSTHHILAGNVDEATRLIQLMPQQTLLQSYRRCGILVTGKFSRFLSSEQKRALKKKRQIIKSFLESRYGISLNN